MLLVSDVTNVAQVWVDACELSLTDLFSPLERHVAASPYICVSMTVCCVGTCLSSCFVGRIEFHHHSTNVPALKQRFVARRERTGATCALRTTVSGPQHSELHLNPLVLLVQLASCTVIKALAKFATQAETPQSGWLTSTSVLPPAV